MTKKSKANVYKVKEPTVDHALMLAGILAFGASDWRFVAAIQNKQEKAAMVHLFTSALANPAGRSQVHDLLVELWDFEPRTENGSDPREAKLQAFSKLPPTALISLIQSLTETTNFSDFLASLREFAPALSEEDGTGTSTESNTDTGGETTRS